MEVGLNLLLDDAEFHDEKDDADFSFIIVKNYAYFDNTIFKKGLCLNHAKINNIRLKGDDDKRLYY